MKTLAILACAAALIGCADTTPPPSTTTTAARTEEATSAGPKKVYTRQDLDRSGHSTVGGQLRTLDPDVSATGN